MIYGHPGMLAIPRLAMEEFKQAAGVGIKDIPFRSGPQAIAELLGGRIDVVSMVMGTEIGQNVRVIGVFAEKRIATAPDAPTVKEQGYDVAPASFGGLLAPTRHARRRWCAKFARPAQKDSRRRKAGVDVYA